MFYETKRYDWVVIGGSHSDSCPHSNRLSQARWGGRLEEKLLLYLHEKHNRTNEYNIEFARFGEAVAISADGNRLVFGGNEVVEVWDWQDKDWVFE